MSVLVDAAQVTALIIGVGGASTVIYKGFRMARRFGHFIDKLAGNGDSEPGILARLEQLKSDVDDLSHGQVILTQGADERTRQINDLTAAVTTMGDKIDNHVDGDAPKLLADGQAWGNRLQDQADSNTRRIEALEAVDPLTSGHAGSSSPS